METPNKSNLLNSTLSPVRFPTNSPKTSTTPRTTIPTSVNQRTGIIIKQLLTNHEKWEEGQKQGLLVCNAIERHKLKVIEINQKVDSLYPVELKKLCEKLSSILDVFKSIASYAIEAKRQLEALQKLNTSPSDPIYRTWTHQDFVDFCGKMIGLYDEEIKIKTIVSENIAHSTTKANLIMHVAVWEYPTHVNQDVKLSFDILNKECF